MDSPHILSYYSGPCLERPLLNQLPPFTPDHLSLDRTNSHSKVPVLNDHLPYTTNDQLFMANDSLLTCLNDRCFIVMSAVSDRLATAESRKASDRTRSRISCDTKFIFEPFLRYRLVENRTVPNDPRMTLSTEVPKVPCVH